MIHLDPRPNPRLRCKRHYDGAASVKNDFEWDSNPRFAPAILGFQPRLLVPGCSNREHRSNHLATKARRLVDDKSKRYIFNHKSLCCSFKKILHLFKFTNQFHFVANAYISQSYHSTKAMFSKHRFFDLFGCWRLYVTRVGYIGLNWAADPTCDFKF